MGSVKDGTSWIEKFYNGNISSDGTATVCVDIGGAEEPLRTSARTDTGKAERIGGRDLFYAAERGDCSNSQEKNYADSRWKQLNLKSEFSILLRGEKMGENR